MPQLEKLNAQRQLDSIKRLGIENPETRKRYRIEKIIEVLRTFTLQNVVRTVKKNENYVKALEFESSSFSVSQARDDSPATTSIDSGDKNYELEISILEFVNEVKTNALFIHSLGFENDLGYYTGSYEAGLIKIVNSQLTIDRIIKSERLTYGLYDFQAQLFLLSKMYQINCYQVNWESEPEVSWTTLVPEMSMGMVVSRKEVGNFMFTGHKDGSVQFRDLLTGKIIHTYTYDGDPIRNLSWVDGDIVAALEKGGLFRISKDGHLKWRSYLPLNVTIMGFTYANNFLWVTNTAGIIFKVDPVNGRVQEQYKGLQHETSSPVAIFNKEWLIYDNPNQLNWQHMHDTSLTGKIDVEETKIRAITTTDKGVIVGDDSGKLLFFKSPGIILKEKT
jgi:WD40 repeat protein